MDERVAIVGPGRVGTALAARLERGGCNVLGFVGRTAAAAERAVHTAGTGRALEVTDLGQATCVLLALPDDTLAAVASELAAAEAGTPATLWVHTSGLHGLDVLAPLARRGATVGSWHPACPVPDAGAAIALLAGKPAVLQGDTAAAQRLHALAACAGMRPMLIPDTDRALYHAACALAANGTTALFDLVETLFAVRCGLEAPDARLLTTALMEAALRGCAERGSEWALSGPVQRGDDATVERHLGALAHGGVEGVDSYRALMQHAATVAARAGDLSPEVQSRLVALLRGGE